jgi:hypothetical protein
LAKAKKVKGIKCDDSVLENARRIIDVRLEEMLGFGVHAYDPTRIEEIHNLRIAAKRLRYTLEMFRFAFPKKLGSLISEVKEVQEHIGDMRDADVMIERVMSILDQERASRAERLRQIAEATTRGTPAQRHQRIKSAVSGPSFPRDEIALYTMVAYRAQERDEAYERFVRHWERMEASDFPTRLRRVTGILPEEEDPAPTVEPPVVDEPQADTDELTPEEQT